MRIAAAIAIILPDHVMSIPSIPTRTFFTQAAVNAHALTVRPACAFTLEAVAEQTPTHGRSLAR